MLIREPTPHPGHAVSQTALLELVPDALVGVSESGEIVFANARAETLFGYTCEQLVGRPLELLLPDRYASAHRAHRAAYSADPRARAMGAGLELAGRRRDGSEFPAEISLASIEIDGQLLATAAIRDISERLTLARERERLTTDAEAERLRHQLQHGRRLESLGELAGGIAHDFNNLLAVIINYAAFVADDLQGAPQEISQDRRASMREDVEQISRAAERAAELTHQLLAFARREVALPEVVDVNSVVSAVGKLLERTLGEDIELRSSLADDLSSVLIDPGQLEQILVNLAVNARDAMPEGGTLTIDTANDELDEAYTTQRPELSPGSYVRLRVSDTGTGMAPEVAERAFDPFFTTKLSGHGTGLGLATVYGIIQQASGSARIRSEPGVGTTFTALLPATDRAAAPPTRTVDAAGPGGNETILLVENEAALRELMRRLLTESGYRVIAACDGAEALEEAQGYEESIDLLLTDVVMPRMHGHELAEQIARISPATKVMYMSGFAQPYLGSRGQLEERVVLIEKPFSGSGLLAKVRQALGRPLALR